MFVSVMNITLQAAHDGNVLFTARQTHVNICAGHLHTRSALLFWSALLKALCRQHLHKIAAQECRLMLNAQQTSG